MQSPWRSSSKHLPLFFLASCLAIVAVVVSPAHSEQQPEVPSQIGLIVGAGNAKAYAAMAKWADGYQRTSGVAVNFQSIGSGAGINQIQSKAVDFAIGGVLDPNIAHQLGLVQWPIAVSGVDPVVNLPGIASGVLRLNGQALADIYLGKIKRWNDPKIKALNPRLTLPTLDIHPIHWSIGSSTTLAFTSYLSAASTEWRVRVGVNASSFMEWPGGVGVGAKGNEGVTATVIQTPGAIGYVDHGFADENNLVTVLTANQDGKYIKPNKDSLASCIASFGVERGSAPEQLLLGRSNSSAMCDVQFVAIHGVSDDPHRTAAVLAFFDWVMSNGAETASEVHLGPVPPDVAVHIRDIWKRQIRSEDGQAIYH